MTVAETRYRPPFNPAAAGPASPRPSEPPRAQRTCPGCRERLHPAHSLLPVSAAAAATAGASEHFEMSATRLLSAGTRGLAASKEEKPPSVPSHCRARLLDTISEANAVTGHEHEVPGGHTWTFPRPSLQGRLAGESPSPRKQRLLLRVGGAGSQPQFKTKHR